MASDRIAADPLADRVHQDCIDRARRGLRMQQPSRLAQRFEQLVDDEQKMSNVSLSEAMAAVAEREPDLYRTVRDNDSVMLTGTQAQLDAAHLGHAPRGGRTADEYRLEHPASLSADDIEHDILSLRNGMLEGTGQKKAGNAADLDSGGLRAEARQRGYVPVDEKVQNYLDADQITQDEEGDPSIERVMAALAWLHKNGLQPSAGNIRRAYAATATK
jgi:hypothetical protein